MIHGKELVHPLRRYASWREYERLEGHYDVPMPDHRPRFNLTPWIRMIEEAGGQVTVGPGRMVLPDALRHQEMVLCSSANNRMEFEHFYRPSFYWPGMTDGCLITDELDDEEVQYVVWG